MAVCVYGSVYAHVYEATAWPAFRAASSLVAMTLQNSTRCMGLWGKMYLRIVAREKGEGITLGLGGLGLPAGGVCGEIDAGQNGKRLVGCSEGRGGAGRFPLARPCVATSTCDIRCV